MLKRLFLTVAAVLAIAASGLVMVSCKAAEARERADEWSSHLESTLQKKDKVDQLILKLRAGEVVPENAVNEIVALLPPEWQAKVRDAQAKGQEALKIAADVSTALGMTFETGLQELEKFKASIASAEADDDVTREVLVGVVSGLGTLLGVGGPVSLIANIFGRKTGNAQAASVVAAGRAADPMLNEAFASGPGHDVMKGLVARFPRLSAAIEKANEAVPYPLTDIKAMSAGAQKSA